MVALRAELMRRVLVLQARTSSSRLPRKVLADLGGRPMLVQQIRRLRRCEAVDEIVVATTLQESDDPVVDLARKEDVRWFRGDERDVLARFVGAAREAKADVVIRATADCPLIEAPEVDRVIRELCACAGEADYASNVIRRTFPRGLDAEALYSDVLERLHRIARSEKSREHVTWFINRERPDLFVRRSVMDVSDNSDLRWTVDTAEDLEGIRKIYTGLDLGDKDRPYREILAYVRAHPEVAAANEGVVQKDL